MRREVTDRAPIVSAELPDTGERFEGVMPPVATAPCFSIRKPAQVLYRLSDYVAGRIMTPPQAQLLRQVVTDRRNIVVVGGTSSGKTTLVNALLAEVASLGERVVILEDTRELQCAAEDVVALRIKPGVASLADLVRSTLRLRPDRIIVGEVRGPEALDMLKAWNTGHPGGVTTVHANSGRGALLRLEQLVQEAVVTVPRALIAEADVAGPVVADTGVNIEQIRFRYRIEGDAPWKPRQVIGPDAKPALVNYRVRGTTYIVDRLFAAAELRLGTAPQQVVRIVRTDAVWREVAQ